MCGVIINDDVYVFVLANLTFNLLKKTKKFFVRMFFITSTRYAPSGDLKGGKKSTCAIPFIIMRYRSTASFL